VVVAPSHPTTMVRLAPLAVVLLALATRLIVAANTWEFPLVRNPQLDSLELLTWASNILTGGYPWPSPPTHGAVYAHFLALLLAVSDRSLYTVRLWQALLGTGTVWLTMELARRFYGQTVSLVAGVILAVYGPLIYIDVSLYEEGVFVFLLVLSLLLASRLRSSLGAAVLGACLGAAASTRPTALILLPLYVWWAARSFKATPQRWLAAVSVVAACVIALSPVLAKNYQSSGRLTLRGFGGLNVYMGNRPGSQGTAEARVGEQWDRLQGEPSAHGLTSLADQDGYFVRKAVAEIRERPVAWLGVVLRKLGWLISRTEVRDSHSYHFFAQGSSLGLLPGFGLLFPLAVVGLFLGRPSRAGSGGLLMGYLALFAGTSVALVVGLRYRIPLVPVLAIFAAYGVKEVAVVVRDQGWRRAVPVAALAAACGALTGVIVHHPSYNFSEEYAFTGNALLREHDLNGAEAAFQQAVAADPQRALGWNGLGVVAGNRGLLDEAEADFRTALSREPSFVRSQYLLGTVFQRRGNLAAALVQFRLAFSVRPDDSEVVSSLADALLASGDAAGALVHYRFLEKHSPPNADLYVAMARAEGVLEHASESRRLAELATRLEPSNGQTWFILSAAQRAGGDLTAAEKSLDRAASLLGRGVLEVRLAEALLRRAQGRRSEAEEVLRRVLDEAPNSADARALWMGFAAEDGRLKEAQALLDRLDQPRPPQAIR
jgi:tetratricopeptide (TPR) repeat protein